MALGFPNKIPRMQPSCTRIKTRSSSAFNFYKDISFWKSGWIHEGRLSFWILLRHLGITSSSNKILRTPDKPQNIFSQWGFVHHLIKLTAKWSFCEVPQNLKKKHYLLIIVIFYKFLKFFNVTDRLQILLHMGQCCKMICGVFKKKKPKTFTSSKMNFSSFFFFSGSHGYRNGNRESEPS